MFNTGFGNDALDLHHAQKTGLCLAEWGQRRSLSGWDLSFPLPPAASDLQCSNRSSIFISNKQLTQTHHPHLDPNPSCCLSSEPPRRSPAEAGSSARESRIHGRAGLLSSPSESSSITPLTQRSSLYNDRQKHLAEQVRCMEMTTLQLAKLLQLHNIFNSQQSLTLQASSLPAAWYCQKKETNSRGIKSFPSSSSQAARSAEARGSFTRNGWPPQPGHHSPAA